MIEPFHSDNAAAHGANGTPTPAATHEPPSIEGLLFAAGAISADQLGEVVRDAVLTQRPVASVALERGFVTRDRLAELLPAVGAHASLAEALGEVETVAVEAPSPAIAAVHQAVAAAAAPVQAPVVESAPAVSVEERIRAVALAAEHPLPAPLPAIAEDAQPAAGPPAAFAVSIRLESGERVAVDTAESFERAAELAHGLVETVSTSGEWPFVSGRFIRPAAIVSIDVERALAG